MGKRKECLRLTGAPITNRTAMSFGRFLAKYEIEVRELSVWHRVGGEWVRDKPMQDTITEVAGTWATSAVVSTTMAPVLAPAAAALAVALGPLALPLAIGMSAGSAALNHNLRKSTKGGSKGGDATMIEFVYGERVGARWSPWADYLTAVWGLNHGMHLSGNVSAGHVEQGERYFLKYGKGKYPTPWGSRAAQRAATGAKRQKSTGGAPKAYRARRKRQRGSYRGKR